MDGHLPVEAMDGYARRSLAPADLLSADDHLESCALCRERISDAEGVKEAVRSLGEALRPAAGREEAHLTYEQLETHAAGILSRADREIIDAHVAECDVCAAEARDLSAFARSARAAIGPAAADRPGGLPGSREKRPAASETGRALHLDLALPAEPTLRAEPGPGPETDATREAGPALEAAPPPARGFPGPVLLATLAAGLAAAVAAAWLVPAGLRRQVRDLTDQAEALRKANEALALQAGEVESLRADLEKARSGSAAAPADGGETAAVEPAIPPPAVTLADRRGPVGLDANGDLIGLDALSVAAGRAIAAALRSGRAGVPADLQDLMGAPAGHGRKAPAGRGEQAAATEAAAGSAGQLLAPVATVVRDARPTFSWRPQAGAASYTVALYDAGLNPVARSEPLARTSWRPSRPLTRGGLYVWQVIARRAESDLQPASDAAPEGRFRVLGAAESAALERSLRDAGGSHLAAGVLLARAGCVGEARRELQELLKKNPDSPLARDLLKSVSPGAESADQHHGGGGSRGPAG